jgi:hypothetical protein
MKTKRQPDPQSIVDLTGDYEAWMRTQTQVVEVDLRAKHEAMRESPFKFLRATFYAWAHMWPIAFPQESTAPAVTTVGDLHMENFGTWRDIEGRLAWGINDFDEAATLPYTSDLVRLATSAKLAGDSARLKASGKDLATAFLDAYTACLRDGGDGEPIVFAERHKAIGESVLTHLVQPESFWKKLLAEEQTSRAVPVPGPCEAALRAALPTGTPNVHIRPRIAGVGSLGRQRFVAIVDRNGGRIAREAKAFMPSAAVWAGTAGPPLAAESAFGHLLAASKRSPDPFLHTNNGFVVRRLAPDTNKIEIKKLGRLLEVELAALIGIEVANVHLATSGAANAIVSDLEGRPAGWLLAAAERMAELTEDCHKVWKKKGGRKK